MIRACSDLVKTIKAIFVAEKFNFFGKKGFLGERFRIKGLFYMSYKMTISVQSHMLKVNYFLSHQGHLGGHAVVVG